MLDLKKLRMVTNFFKDKKNHNFKKKLVYNNFFFSRSVWSYDHSSFNMELSLDESIQRFTRIYGHPKNTRKAKNMRLAMIALLIVEMAALGYFLRGQ